eukprot:m.296027 g.296027  ORF g.296027 m.296027 type:complete len:109 (+) comp27188_c0_seq1:3314-3640(+)
MDTCTCIASLDIQSHIASSDEHLDDGPSTHPSADLTPTIHVRLHCTANRYGRRSIKNALRTRRMMCMDGDGCLATSTSTSPHAPLCRMRQPPDSELEDTACTDEDVEN